MQEKYKIDLDTKSRQLAKVKDSIIIMKEEYEELQATINSYYKFKETFQIGSVKTAMLYVAKLNSDALKLSEQIEEKAKDIEEITAAMWHIMLKMKKLDILVDRHAKQKIYEDGRLEQKETDAFTHRSFWGHSPL